MTPDSTPSRRFRGAATLCIALLPVVAGCSSDDSPTTAPVSLVDFAFEEIPDQLDAGTVVFELRNDGTFNHELVVVEGNSYESLPQRDSGAVDEEQLPAAALVGRSDIVNPGRESTLEVELDPGTYVLVCNIPSFDESTSHAREGMVRTLTVT